MGVVWCWYIDLILGVVTEVGVAMDDAAGFCAT